MTRFDGARAMVATALRCSVRTSEGAGVALRRESLSAEITAEARCIG
jgi:hypothetical protein